jgi:DNA mismatch repair protein MutS
MAQLEKLIHSSYQNLFAIDEGGGIYDEPNQILDLVSPRIIDENTLVAIEIPHLFEAINHTQTKTGAATLFRSLIQPLDSLELIHEKQNSVRELEKDKELRRELRGYVSSVAKREPYLHRYLFNCVYCQNEPYNPRNINQYKMHRGFMDFFKNVVGEAKRLPTPSSQYLKVLVEDLRNLDSTRIFELIKGPVYETFEASSFWMNWPRQPPTKRRWKYLIPS